MAAQRANITATFRVKIVLPKGVTMQEAQRYLKDAILSHSGELGPANLFSNLGPDAVTVGLLKKEVTYG